MKKILKCGVLFDATSENCLKKNQFILVEGSKITGIGPVETLRAEGAEIIDLSGKFVMPGLIDSHVHLQFDSRSNPGEMLGRSSTFYMTIPEMTIRSLVTANIQLMAGVTTIRNMGSIGMSDLAVRNSINKGMVKGPRIFACGTPICASGGHGDTNFRPEIKGGAMGTIIDGPTEALSAVRWTLKYGADGIKVAASGNEVDYDPAKGGFPELTYEEMKVIADIAHTQNKVCAAHTISAPSIKNAVLAGFDTIEHGICMDQECRELMLERGTWLVPTLACFHLFIVNADKMGLRDAGLARAKEQYKYMEENMMICREMGIPLGVGSDASTPFNPHGTNSLELVKMADAGMPPAEVLMAATRGNAKMLKWDKQIGTIEVGKFADIAAFDSNPIDDLNVLQNCTFVMKDGEIFKQ